LPHAFEFRKFAGACRVPGHAVAPLGGGERIMGGNQTSATVIGDSDLPPRKWRSHHRCSGAAKARSNIAELAGHDHGHDRQCAQADVHSEHSCNNLGDGRAAVGRTLIEMRAVRFPDRLTSRESLQ
jgi:hypothetical protein